MGSHYTNNTHTYPYTYTIIISSIFVVHGNTCNATARQCNCHKRLWPRRSDTSNCRPDAARRRAAQLFDRWQWFLWLWLITASVAFGRLVRTYARVSVCVSDAWSAAGTARDCPRRGRNMSQNSRSTGRFRRCCSWLDSDSDPCLLRCPHLHLFIVYCCMLQVYKFYHQQINNSVGRI